MHAAKDLMTEASNTTALLDVESAAAMVPDLATRVKTRVINSADYHAWDRYIGAHATAGVYLTTAWKQAIETSYGHKTFYLGAFDGNRLGGVLPLVLIRPPLGQRGLVSLPYCDYGGILADNSLIARRLLDEAVVQAAEFQAVLEIRVPEPCPVLEKAVGFYQTTDKCRMLLELPGSSKLLWNGFKSKLRSQINRARKNGLVCRIGHEELLRDFYSVFSRNMRDLGSPVHSENWLRSVLVAFGDYAHTGVVYHDGSPVAAGIILTHGKLITIPWASSLRKFNFLSPNMLLYWALLEYAADHGARVFDFGRSTPGERTYLFKQQWGAKPIPLNWFRQHTAVAQEDAPRKDRALRSLVERLWRTLPVFVANTAGPRIRKYISR
jgi:FemAB-related protein (PEP-CTERM system-associated)